MFVTFRLFGVKNVAVLTSAALFGFSSGMPLVLALRLITLGIGVRGFGDLEVDEDGESAIENATLFTLRAAPGVLIMLRGVLPTDDSDSLWKF